MNRNIILSQLHDYSIIQQQQKKKRQLEVHDQSRDLCIPLRNEQRLLFITVRVS